MVEARPKGVALVVIACVAAAAALSLVLPARASQPAEAALSVEVKAVRASDLLRTPKSLAKETQPDIVHIVLDDIGMNDLWDSTDIPDSVAANIRDLASEGMVLSNYYGQAYCTPARSALMTGMFGHRTGFSGADVHSATTNEITVWSNFSIINAETTTLLPEHMTNVGYESHGVGKWNLGHCNDKLLPTSRGFSTFFGYFGAGLSYVSHLVEGTPTSPNTFTALSGGDTYSLYDMSDCSSESGCAPAWEYAGNYTTSVFTSKAVSLIEAKADAPLYVYLSYHGVHDDAHVNATWRNIDSEVMSDIIATLSQVRRRNFAMGLYEIDQGVGKVRAALEAQSASNFVMVLHADNGGSPCGSYCDGNNFPLRGMKFYEFEGALRVPCLIFAPGLITGDLAGAEYAGLMHHVDWVATLRSITTQEYTCDQLVCDSVSHWDTMLAKDAGAYDVRQTIAFSITGKYATLRHRDYKMLVQRSNSSWYPPTYEIFQDTSSCMASSTDDFLFDLASDPYEHHNLYYDADYAHVLEAMTTLWHETYTSQGVNRNFPVGESTSDPKTIAAFINSNPGNSKYAVAWECAMS